MRSAISMIDEAGLRQLSMRRLGNRLGVEAMAIYRHVPSRANLLDAVVEAVIDELYGDPEVHLLPSAGWEDYVSRLAHGVRRITVAHPRVFPLIATHPPAAPWVRPPLRSLRWVDSFLEGLLSQGFTDAGAVSACQAFSAFLLGFLLLEATSRSPDIDVTGSGADTGDAPADTGGGPTGVGQPEVAADAGGNATYPQLARLATLLAQDRSEEQFMAGLADILARLARVHDAG